MWTHALAALAAPDPVRWAEPLEGEAIRLVVIGDLPEDASALIAAVAVTEPDLWVFTGVGPKDDLARWGVEGRVLAVADGAPGRAFIARFPGIGGDRPLPYGALDLRAGGTRWRVLHVTAATRPATRWDEQAWWLPKALERSAYDRLIVLADAPRHTLSEADPSPGARYLLDAVQDAADPLSFTAWIAGNTSTNEVFSPGGRFGELHLVAGTSGGPAGGFAPEGQGIPGIAGRARQEPGWLAALGPPREWHASPVGFWTIELAGDRMDVAFHRESAEGWEVTWRMARTNAGWAPP